MTAVERHALDRSFAMLLERDRGGGKLLTRAKKLRVRWRSAQLQEVAVAPGGQRPQLSGAACGKLVVLGGAGNGAAAAARAVGACTAPVEAHPPSRRLAAARLREFSQAASQEERAAALEAEVCRARASHMQALDDLKVEHKVSLAAQENESAQALNAEREEQTALAKARAVALAEADARTAKADERAVEGASAAWEAAVAKQRQFVGEHEAEHARALQAAEQTAKVRQRDVHDVYAEERAGLGLDSRPRPRPTRRHGGSFGRRRRSPRRGRQRRRPSPRQPPQRPTKMGCEAWKSSLLFRERPPSRRVQKKKFRQLGSGLERT